MTSNKEISILHIEENIDDNVNILSVKGSLDAFSAESLESKIGELYNNGRYNIAIGLEGLDYISSAGLGVFMSYIEEIRENGGDIKLYGLSDKIYRIFDLLGFPLIFNISESKEKCIANFEVAA